jgi:hypothetical protein
MTEDPRCCGSGTCIIDTEGRCWCGQQWDGQRMCSPGLAPSAPASATQDDDTAAGEDH